MITREYFKVVLLGESGTGKTCMMKRYFNNIFDSKVHSTLGAAFSSKICKVNDKEYQMGVWDTSGDERYRAVTSLYYRTAAAAIICYDITLHSTFQQTDYWIKELHKIQDSCRIYLCANKCDLLSELEANPTLSFAERFASERNAKFFKTSSKTGENIDMVFDAILEDYITHFLIPPKNLNTIKLLTDKKKKKRRTKKCCSDE